MGLAGILGLTKFMRANSRMDRQMDGAGSSIKLVSTMDILKMIKKMAKGLLKVSNEIYAVINY